MAQPRPKPLLEVAKMLGVSRSTMWALVNELGLTKYQMPGAGKAVYLDPDEVRRKRQPKLATKRRRTDA